MEKIKNLVIVESPAKAKTIEKILGKDFKVVSSFGHIRDLKKKGVAIDIEKGFEPDYEVSPDKKKVVADLRKLSKSSDKVWLASDEDREGEAIAWHLSQALKLDEKTTDRIVFHEITSSAITKAIQNPRKIDHNLVNAQQARRVLDRLVGFELSPVLWKKIKPGLSAGRVQSVAVRLIVERERDIQRFNAESSFRVVAEFKNEEGATFQADLSKKFKSKTEANAFLKACVNETFTISQLDKKPAKRTPAAPFTTSTLQQEASRKLGFSVAQTMRVAQQLYETGAITYMRTDSVNLSDTAKKAAKDEIYRAYGEAYHKQRNYSTKSKGAQEAHEAIRPTNMAMHNFSGDSQQSRLYQLIWMRTIASQMADAQIERTTATIDFSNKKSLSGDAHFVAKGEIIRFDGFIKAYLEGSDEDDIEEKNALPPIYQDQTLTADTISATERFSRPPARYTEASLVKKLEELGIGRPSTYAPTISTIQKREYVVKPKLDGTVRNYSKLTLDGANIKEETLSETTGADKNKLVPTDIGMVVNDYLVEHFDSIMDFNFTANVENEFDKIAHGQREWNKFLETFYGPFHKHVVEAEEGERFSGERELGTDPASNLPVIARIGRFGPLVQIGTSGDENNPPKYANIPANASLDTITLEEALDLFQLPKDLGEYKGEAVSVAQGRFGPYVKFGSTFVSLAKGEDPMGVDKDRAIELIEAKLKADAPIGEFEGMPVQKGVGRFGPFIKWNNTFINVNKKYDFDNLSQADIEQLILDKRQKDIDKVIHNWEDEGIKLEKARWGRFNLIKGKTKVELPKTTEAKDMTLEEAKAILEKNTPKKATRKKAKK